MADLLSVEGITKEYPGVRALDEVTLTFRAGEVHGIVGENGAGKSTLMNVIAGLQRPTAGQVLIDGQPVAWRSVREAAAAGVVMIHQELNLVDDLSVAANIALGHELGGRLRLDESAMLEQAVRLLQRVNSQIDPREMVRNLSIAEKQLVEIARSLRADARILIMDEPTAVLTERESEALFAIVRELRDKGVAVIYISHLLREMIDLCDRISVLRDGRWVETREAKSSTPSELANAMVGRDVGEFFPPKSKLDMASPVAIRAVDVSVPARVSGVSLEVRQGEILGIAGLVGAGRTELAEALAGFRRRTGRVEVAGEILAPGLPVAARDAGLVYVSEDRKALGLHLDLSCQTNLTLADLRRIAKLLTNPAKEREVAEKWKTELDIRVADLGNRVRTLSGGNQQKISISKWLQTSPRVLILDEPTRGVDVGAKQEIYRVIQNLAKDDLAVIMISSELTEIIGVCHRALVLRSGVAVGELAGEELTEPGLIRLAAGVAA